MKSVFKIILFLLPPAFSQGQENRLDRLKQELKNAANDTLRIGIYTELSTYYYQKKIDSALYFNEESLLLAQKLKLKLGQAWLLSNKGDLLKGMRNYPASYQSLLLGLKIAEDPESEKSFWRWRFIPKEMTPRKNRLDALVYLHRELEDLYSLTGDTAKRILENLEMRRIAVELNDSSLISFANKGLGQIYFESNKLDSALAFYKTAMNLSLSNGYKNQLPDILVGIGDIYYKKASNVLAKQYYWAALRLSIERNSWSNSGQPYSKLAILFLDEGEKDSSLYYATKSMEKFESLNSYAGMETAYTILASIYKLRNKPDSAFKYQGLAMAAKDSLNESESLKKYLNISFEEQFRLQELEKDKIQFRNKVRTNVMLAGIGISLLLAIIFYRNVRQRQKAKAKIEVAYNELKETQHQLIQREKMASLGELTSGIAHEIQNPLNFVNNFSDVNAELIEELKAEALKGNQEEVIAIANDIKANEEKINHHGKRADSIVKGMLQHSRTNSGQKELTDINALADEYLRLAYHGLRAKDKSFNANFKTDFDHTVGKVNIIPQDIGRVILNLINNAFYAVDEKKKKSGDGYEPLVIVSTKTVKPPLEGLEAKVEISVKDNGNGIPHKILDKIFQPFFTTKPTGQGTGLGLSLSYDIITKGHGGELKVETKEGEGSEFIVQLPAN